MSKMHFKGESNIKLDKQGQISLGFYIYYFNSIYIIHTLGLYIHTYSIYYSSK